MFSLYGARQPEIPVKTQDDKEEPDDIANVSDIVKTLRDEQRIQRAYAPGLDEMAELKKILEEEKK